MTTVINYCKQYTLFSTCYSMSMPKDFLTYTTYTNGYREKQVKPI